MTPLELPLLKKEHLVKIDATYNSEAIQRNESDLYYFKILDKDGKQ